MKRILLLALLLGLSALTVGATEVNPTYEIIVSQYGTRARDSVNASNVMAALGTRDARMIFDGGTWSMSNSFTFPSNISIYIGEGSYWDVSTNITITFQTNSFEAGGWRCFQGDGAVTGTGNFLYRWLEWGDMTKFNIGLGKFGFTNLSGIVHTDASFTMANGTTGTFDQVVAQNIQVNDSLIVNTNVTIGNNLVVSNNITGFGDLTIGNTNVMATIANLDTASSNSLSYVYGFDMIYNDSDTITIRPGECRANGVYYRLSTNYNIDLAGIATIVDQYYIYIDDTESSTPDPVLISSTTEPARTNNGARIGYYNGDDRCVESVTTTNGAVFTFSSTLGRHRFSAAFICALSQNPVAAGWIVPNTAEVSSFLPVNAKSVYITAKSDHSGNFAEIAAIQTELTNSTTHTTPNSGAFYDRTQEDAYISGWMEVGAGGNISFSADPDDDNGGISAYVGGVEVER